MENATYSFRPTFFRTEIVYRLTGEALTWSSSSGTGSQRLAEIDKIRVYAVPGSPGIMGVASGSIERCVIWPKQGRTVVITSRHVVRFGKFEDRTMTFRPFVEALMARAARANPSAHFLAGMPPVLWWVWMLSIASLAIASSLAGLVVLVELFAEPRNVLVRIITAALLAGAAFGLYPILRALLRDRPRRL